VLELLSLYSRFTDQIFPFGFGFRFGVEFVSGSVFTEPIFFVVFFGRFPSRSSISFARVSVTSRSARYFFVAHQSPDFGQSARAGPRAFPLRCCPDRGFSLGFCTRPVSMSSGPCASTDFTVAIPFGVSPMRSDFLSLVVFLSRLCFPSFRRWS
jgi:hypothetical protein